MCYRPYRPYPSYLRGEMTQLSVLSSWWCKCKMLEKDFESSHTFKGVNVSQPSDGVFRGQFFLFPWLTTLSAGWITTKLFAATINPSNWPSDEDECILYGDEKLLTIQKTVLQPVPYSKELHKFNCHGVRGENLRKVLTLGYNYN